MNQDEQPRLTRKASLWQCKYNRKARKSRKTRTKYLWLAEKCATIWDRRGRREKKSFDGRKSCETFYIRCIDKVDLERPEFHATNVKQVNFHRCCSFSLIHAEMKPP